jgi:hypothetical protein
MVRSRDVLTRVSQGVVFALAVSAPLGSYASGFQAFGLSIFLFRLAVLGALPLAVATAGRHSKRLARPILGLMLVVAVWWLVGAAGFQWWSLGTETGLKSLAAVGFGLALLVLVWLLPCEWEQIGDALVTGWQVGFMITSLVAFWEVVFMRHLPGYLMDTAPAYFLDNRFAMSTLGNPNNYGAYLLYVLAILLAGAVSTTSPRARILHYLGVGLTVGLLVMSGARVALLGCVVEVAVLVAVSARRQRGRVALLVLLLAGVAYVVVVNWGGYALAKLGTLMSGFSTQGSLQARLNLALNGAFLSFQHFGLGVGPGGFGPSVASGTVPFNTFGFVDPHSFFTEVASEYGVFSLAGFLLWLVGLLRLTVRRVGFDGTTPSAAKRWRLMLLLGLTAYVFAVFENSTYMSESTNWAFLTTLAVFACSLKAEAKRTEAKGHRSASRLRVPASSESGLESDDTVTRGRQADRFAAGSKVVPMKES